MTNGGGFLAGASGTDYSQQIAAQVTYSDLVIGNPTTTNLTSALNPFTAAHVGNVINITGGVNFTTGRYQVMSVAAGVATMDRAVGTAGATGGAGKLGGAVTKLGDISTIWVAGNTIYVMATATYSFAATLTMTVAGTDGLPIWIIGYTSVRGDNGPVTLQCSNGAAAPMISFATARHFIQNFLVDGNSLTQRGFNASGAHVNFYNCHFKNCTLTGLLHTGAGHVDRCSATNCGVAGTHNAGGFYCSAGIVLYERCVSWANISSGFGSQNITSTYLYCLSYDNALDGFYHLGTEGPRILNCTIDGNTLDGVRFDSSGGPLDSPLLVNNMITNNAGWGVRSITVDYSAKAAYGLHFFNNAYYLNTLGVRTQVPAGTGDITLTADPYASRSTKNFALNTTAGGGLLLNDLGVPGAFGPTFMTFASTSVTDVGAVQSSTAPDSTATMRTLWRELTNELDTTTILNTVVDIYLNEGLKELNRRIRYHRTTDTTTLALLAGTQEYAVPSDFVYPEWIEFNGQRLQKRDVDSWERDGTQWRAKSGRPQEYAIQGNKVIFFPIPDAAAIADDGSPDLRYVSTPPSVTTSGPEQLGSQDTDIAVYYGVALWSMAHPDSAIAQGRLQGMMALFEAGVERIKNDYAERSVAS